MEVASPLTFDPRGVAGTKRQFQSFSPSFGESTNRSPLGGGLSDHHMDGSINNARSFKRRRFNVDSTMDDVENFTPQSPFIGFPVATKSVFAPSGSTTKRSRTDNQVGPSVQQDLRPLLESQAAEIETLKADKQSLGSSLGGLQTEHERVVKENKLLRKAVTIQQDRQNHANTELEAARTFRTAAEQQIKKLEHVIMTLRYHLQTQQSHPGNDFMGNRPPDVY